MFTLDDILEIAIQMEKNGEAIYSSAIKNTRRKPLKDLLKWMANEEAAHGKWFADQKNKLPLEMDEAQLKEMVPKALQNMMGEKTLALEDIDFGRIKTVSELLKTFIAFENDTILFYELLEMFVQEKSVLKGLKQILLEEKNHVNELASMMASLPEDSV